MRAGNIAFLPQGYGVLRNRGHAILTLACRFRATNLSIQLAQYWRILYTHVQNFVLNKMMYNMLRFVIMKIILFLFYKRNAGIFCVVTQHLTSRLVYSRKCESQIVYFRSNPYIKQCELMCEQILLYYNFHVSLGDKTEKRYDLFCAWKFRVRIQHW